MAVVRPNVSIINIRPENWEYCVKDHRFGIREGARHPKFTKGDIFFVRRTGQEYGVMGIWVFSREEYLTNPIQVPWDDAEYKWQQWFEPIVDFKTPVSEEFIGKTQFSSKIQMSAARLIGSVATIYEPEIVRYLEMVLKEKPEDCSATVVYQGEKHRRRQCLQL